MALGILRMGQLLIGEVIHMSKVLCITLLQKDVLKVVGGFMIGGRVYGRFHYLSIIISVSTCI